MIDVLIDARRRQNIASLRPLDQFGTPNHLPSGVQFRKDRESTLSDDEPLYDAVADDDYGQLMTPGSGTFQVKSRDKVLRTNYSLD